MYLFAVFALVASVSADIIVDSECPDLKLVDNFNFVAYGQGTWYEVARYPNSAEKHGKCGWAEYTFRADVVKVKNYHVDNNKIKVIEGTHRLAPDANGSGKIIVTLPYGVDGAMAENLLNILAIDYDNYFIGYYCKYDEVKKSRQDFAWILSRSKTLSPAAKNAVNKYLRESNFLDASKFIYPSFSDADCKINV